MVTHRFGGVDFSFTRLAEANFKDVAAIYLIVGTAWNGSPQVVLDVGQSGQLGSRIDSHDRMENWRLYRPDSHIWVGVRAMPTQYYSIQERLQLERQLRLALRPICGDR